MAPYWQTRFRRRRWRPPWRRRNWINRWRIRRTIQRRKYRTKYRRRRFKVKRLKFRKRKLLKLKVWQPKSIRKCKIVGFKCLFQGNYYRAQHNYWQYVYSNVPINQPGGGGWGLLVFSLGSLYEDYDHLNNIWTTSNAGLPLVRYTGCQFKFYQTENTDYIVTYDTCWPMVDTPHTHADSSPFRMLVKRHKIVMPSKQTKNRKRPYKKVKIKPPHQMTNRWYFQKDICNTPLVMLTATAVQLTTPFANINELSNNITFYSLNTFIFQNPNFEHPPETTGYSHKILNGFSMYLYATTTKKPANADSDTNAFKEWLKTLIFLGNPRENKQGKPLGEILTQNTKSNWGNPFYHRYLEIGDEDDVSYTIYTSQCTTINIINKIQGQNPDTVKATNFQTITGPIIYTLTYNPEKDTGLNKIYLLKTWGPATLDEPEDQNLIFEGFPLPNLTWGWTDFVKKLNKINDLDRHSLLLIKTKNFNDNTLNVFMPIDLDFIQGHDPYQPDKENSYQTDNYNYNNWFPKVQFQDQTINEIATSQPASPHKNEYLQAFCNYKFYFKWGGCPKTLEKAYDPCLQSKWTTPDNIQGRLTIQNPNTAPETELYCWDWDKDYVKDSAIARIQEYTKTVEPFISITETKFQPKAIKKQEKDKTTEEEETLFLKLHQLRKERLHLELKYKLQLMQLKSTKATYE
nr:MAG: ORF1 [TTV-like mini virus]